MSDSQDFIFIENPTEQSVVVARNDDGSIRVFYDLNSLMAQFVPAHTVMALSVQTDLDRMRCLGQNDVLSALADSLDFLAAEAGAQGSFDDVNDLSDLFPDEN